MQTRRDFIKRGLLWLPAFIPATRLVMGLPKVIAAAPPKTPVAYWTVYFSATGSDGKLLTLDEANRLFEWSEVDLASGFRLLARREDGGH